MRQAIDPAEIEFVVARGIGTQEADRKEAISITSLLDIDLPVTALKSQTGYLGAATAAVELGLAVSCARHGFVPPIARHAAADPECALSLVAHQPRELERRGTRLGLFLSYSWGGTSRSHRRTRDAGLTISPAPARGSDINVAG